MHLPDVTSVIQNQGIVVVFNYLVGYTYLARQLGSILPNQMIRVEVLTIITLGERIESSLYRGATIQVPIETVRMAKNWVEVYIGDKWANCVERIIKIESAHLRDCQIELSNLEKRYRKITSISKNNPITSDIFHVKSNINAMENSIRVLKSYC